MLNWLKTTSLDERDKPSSNRTGMYWLFGLCSAAFFLGAAGAIFKNKILADWSIKAVGALAGTGGLVGAFGQIKSWLVQRETIKATTTVPIPEASAAPLNMASIPTASIDKPASPPPKKPKLNPPPTPQELRVR